MCHTSQPLISLQCCTQHRTGIAEVMGSNPVGASEFLFLGNCEDHFHFYSKGTIILTHPLINQSCKPSFGKLMSFDCLEEFPCEIMRGCNKVIKCLERTSEGSGRGRGDFDWNFLSLRLVLRQQQLIHTNNSNSRITKQCIK